MRTAAKEIVEFLGNRSKNSSQICKLIATALLAEQPLPLNLLPQDLHKQIEYISGIFESLPPVWARELALELIVENPNGTKSVAG